MALFRCHVLIKFLSILDLLHNTMAHKYTYTVAAKMLMENKITF